MRADRLLALLLLLQTRGRMTAQDLAERLEVSERTIYRDVEALAMAGIPVYAERGPGGGFELVDGYQTTLTGLTAPEACALLLAGVPQQVADLGLDNALGAALLKVVAALPEPLRRDAERLRERIYTDGADAAETRPLTLNATPTRVRRTQGRPIKKRASGHVSSKKPISPLATYAAIGGRAAALKDEIRSLPIKKTRVNQRAA